MLNSTKTKKHATHNSAVANQAQIKKNNSANSIAGVQAKLTVGKSNDKYEQEADRVADKVISMPESGKNISSGTASIQKKCDSCEQEEKVQQKPLAADITPWVQQQSNVSPISLMKDEEKGPMGKPLQKKEDLSTETNVKEEEKDQLSPKLQLQTDEEEIAPKLIQKKSDEEEEKKPLQTKNKSPKSSSSSPSLESRLSNSKSSGSPLPDDTRSYMESRIGTDFGKVKIHTGSNAMQMSQELGAQAFTQGNNVYFNQGKYNPSSIKGKHLLAHELTHTIQQQGSIRGIQKKENKEKTKRPKIEEFKFMPPVYKWMKLLRNYFKYLQICISKSGYSKKVIEDRKFIAKKLKDYTKWTKWFKFRMHKKWSTELKTLIKADLKKAAILEKKYCPTSK